MEPNLHCQRRNSTVAYLIHTFPPSQKNIVLAIIPYFAFYHTSKSPCLPVTPMLVALPSSIPRNVFLLLVVLFVSAEVSGLRLRRQQEFEDFESSSRKERIYS